MYNKTRRLLAYVRQRGMAEAVRKLYKKIMYLLFGRVFASRVALSHPQREIFVPVSEVVQPEEVQTLIAEHAKVGIFLFFYESCEFNKSFADHVKKQTNWTNLEVFFVGSDVATRYSREANAVIQASDVDFLLILPQPIEILDKQWIQVLLGCLVTADTGIASTTDITSWVPSCILVSRKDFMAVGGFNEFFVTSYANTDLCFSILKSGKALRYTNENLFRVRSQLSTVTDITLDQALLRDRWGIEV